MHRNWANTGRGANTKTKKKLLRFRTKSPRFIYATIEASKKCWCNISVALTLSTHLNSIWMRSQWCDRYYPRTHSNSNLLRRSIWPAQSDGNNKHAERIEFDRFCIDFINENGITSFTRNKRAIAGGMVESSTQNCRLPAFIHKIVCMRLRRRRRRRWKRNGGRKELSGARKRHTNTACKACTAIKTSQRAQFLRANPFAAQNVVHIFLWPHRNAVRAVESILRVITFAANYSSITHHCDIGKKPGSSNGRRSLISSQRGIW